MSDLLVTPWFIFENFITELQGFCGVNKIYQLESLSKNLLKLIFIKNFRMDFKSIEENNTSSFYHFIILSVLFLTILE